MTGPKRLTLTSAMAATLTGLAGCSSEPSWDDGVVADRQTAVCVDQAGYRVDDDRCDNPRYRGGGFGWFYVNRGARIPYLNDSIDDPRFRGGGSRQSIAGSDYVRAPKAANMTRSAAVSRGGFGSSGRFFGGGRS